MPVHRHSMDRSTAIRSDTLILTLWDGRLATWRGKHRDGCLYIKVLGDRFRIWIPKGLVRKAGRLHAEAA